MLAFVFVAVAVATVPVFGGRLGATDRKVTAYMSQVHTDPDIAVELFVLEAA